MYVIVAVVVVVIIVAGVGIYLSYHPASTPAPSPSPTPVSVASATSLQFDVNATASNTTTTLDFAAENIGTSNLTIRIDYPAASLSFVLNYGQQKSWESTHSGAAGTWTLDPSFATDNSTWGERFTGEVAALESWNGSGNTYTYTTTSGGVATTVLFYDISVNPTLPASLFQTS